jgi:uncharacterized protein (TIGR03435 family)
MLVAVRLTGHGRAAVRAFILACGFGVLLLLPFATVVLPPVVLDVAYDVEPPRTLVPGYQTRPAAPLAPTILDGSGMTRPVANAELLVVSTPPASRSFPWVQWLRLAWMLAMAGCLIPVAAALWRMRCLRRDAIPWPDGETLARNIAHAAGIRRPLSVLVSRTATVPMVSGFLRPAIVLPPDAPTWGDADIRRALTHECEHIRRADGAIFVVARIVCAVYWFHPGVWIAWRRLHLEAERACDDAVLRCAEGAAYAAQLVRMADRLQSRSRLVPAMAAPGHLTVRVQAVLDPHQPRGRTGARWTSGSGGVAVAALLAIAPLSCQGAPDQAPRPGETSYTVSIREDGRGAAPALPVPGLSLPAHFQVLAGRFVTEGASVSDLVAFAYDMSRWNRERLVVGWPDDVASTRFDVTLSVQHVVPPVPLAERRRIVREVLTDRFGLRTHTETRPMPVLALTLTDEGPGPGLQRLPYDCVSYRRPQPDVTLTDGVCLRGWDFDSPGGMREVGSGHLTTLAERLQNYFGQRQIRPAPGVPPRVAFESTQLEAEPFDRIVVDGTGLEGTYTWDFTFRGRDMEEAFLSRFPERFGLDLEAHEDWPVEVLVNDAVSMPTLD